MSRAPLNVPLHIAKKTPLCIHCKFYIPPKHAQNTLITHDMKLGFCRKTGLVNVIDGGIVYDYVTSAREYECKGDWFELAPSGPLPDPNQPSF